MRAFALLVCTMAGTACFRTNEASSPDAGDAVAPSAPDTYTIDVSRVHHPAADSSDPRQVGLPVGRGFNFEFPIRLEQHQWVFPDSLGAGLPFYIGAGQDSRVAVCDPANRETLEKSLSLVPTGSMSWLEWVEVELVIVDPSGEAGGLCFGYRDAVQTWRWNFAVVDLVATDPGAKRYRGRVQVGKGPVDAVKLVFSSASGFVPKITFSARAMATTAGDR